jgi:Icc-related predicted phosphoesterase
VRILLVSDLHYALPQFDWVVGHMADFDLVVLAGDHLDIASAVPLEAQVAVVDALVGHAGDEGRLVVSSGNHDLTGPDAAGEQSAPWVAALRRHGAAVDGDTVEVDGTLVTVCPWWDGPAGRERVAAQLEADASRARDRWVWVYHWPPDASPTCWTGRRHYGDPDLLAWIEAHGPDVVLTGHVHDPPFKPDGAWADRIGHTWVFNAGRQIGPVPAHIEIDLDEGTAWWHSLMGHEEQPLCEQPRRGAGAARG